MEPTYDAREKPRMGRSSKTNEISRPPKCANVAAALWRRSIKTNIEVESQLKTVQLELETLMERNWATRVPQIFLTRELL
jgi:hypothetical protein